MATATTQRPSTRTDRARKGEDKRSSGPKPESHHRRNRATDKMIKAAYETLVRLVELFDDPVNRAFAVSIFQPPAPYVGGDTGIAWVLRILNEADEAYFEQVQRAIGRAWNIEVAIEARQLVDDFGRLLTPEALEEINLFLEVPSVIDGQLIGFQPDGSNEVRNRIKTLLKPLRIADRQVRENEAARQGKRLDRAA